MSATIASSPATPASCYRPLRYTVQRTDPTLSDVAYVRPADAADVTGLGSGLALDDILVEHTTLNGPVSAAVGQTVLLIGCDGYNGVFEILKVIDSTHLVIDSEDQGSITPASGSIRIWLNNYTVWARLSVYVDPAGDPQTVDMRALPGTDGLTTFHVNEEVARYFNSDIHAYALAVGGGEIYQSAHAVTALWYKVAFAELYDGSGTTDPFDGTHDIDEDADYRVAVNAVHPYSQLDYTGSVQSAGLTRATADMGVHIPTDEDRRWLTNAPRRYDSTLGAYYISLTMATTDRFRLHMLSPSTQPVSDYRLSVYDVTGTPTLVDQIDIVFDVDDMAAFSVAVGPADLSPFITVPAKYRAFLSNSGLGFLSEYIEVTVDSKCKEVRRPMVWQNKLGGIDHFSFTGREVASSSVKRAAVRKPTYYGTGYDFNERVYRAEVDRVRTLSSAPLDQDVRHWIGRDLFEQPNVVCRLSDTQVAPVVITSQEVVSGNTGGIRKPVTIAYRLGVDNESQVA